MKRNQKVAKIQQAHEEATQLEMPTLQMNLPIIATIVTLGTLTGLLGTVTGMIRSFQALAAGGGGDSLQLSTGISEALINTAFGIATSWCAVIAYNFFTNKIDKLTDRPAGLERDDEGRPQRVWLSAQTGEGSEYLFQALTELLAGSMVHHTLQLPPSAARLRSALYRLKGIEQEGFSEEGDFVLEVRLQLADWNRLMKQEGESLQRFIRH